MVEPVGVAAVLASCFFGGDRTRRMVAGTRKPQSYTLGGACQSVAAIADPLEAWLLRPDTGKQTPAHRVLGDGLPEQPFDCPMDGCPTHRPIGRHQDLADRSLNLAVAEASNRTLRLRTHARLDRLIPQSLEHRFQGRRGVCKPF